MICNLKTNASANVLTNSERNRAWVELVSAHRSALMAAWWQTDIEISISTKAIAREKQTNWRRMLVRLREAVTACGRSMHGLLRHRSRTRRQAMWSISRQKSP